MSTATCLAVDLGAESGRIIVGSFDGDCLSVREAHRFDNVPIERGGHLRWNTGGLLKEILLGLGKVGTKTSDVRSLAVDTWGVDFGLVDNEGFLLEEPSHYRDLRTRGFAESLCRRVPGEELFEITGVQPHDINTLCQLQCMLRDDNSLFDRDCRLLMMPDLINFFLSGTMGNEFTIASTSQCLDARQRDWAHALLEKLTIPAHLFKGRPHMPGTELGRLKRPYGDIPALSKTAVVAAASHDTASAVAAISACSSSEAYISSGTWSLMGIVSAAPLISPRALKLGFTNEGGVEGSWRVLKNITGLWLVQQCRKSWAAKGLVLDYEGIAEQARVSCSHQWVFDPNDAALRNPEDMPTAIASLCGGANQPNPQEVGTVARAIFQSLACKYRQTLDQLHELTSTRASLIRIVGGGSKNSYLCQLTADICGVPVLAGPAETTALGNLLVQFVTGGFCQNWEQARAIIGRSFAPTEYLPRSNTTNDVLIEKFEALSRTAQLRN